MQMTVGESTGTGSVGARRAAAVGGRQVHIKEIESTGTGRGGDVRSVAVVRRRLTGAPEVTGAQVSVSGRR